MVEPIILYYLVPRVNNVHVYFMLILHCFLSNKGIFMLAIEVQYAREGVGDADFLVFID